MRGNAGWVSPPVNSPIDIGVCHAAGRAVLDWPPSHYWMFGSITRFRILMAHSISKSHSVLSLLLLCAVVLLLSPATIHAQTAAPGDIVISQVYGGGGSPGSTYQNNFIELFNRSNVPIDISGWPLHFAPATGTFNVAVAFVSSRGILVQPGRYMLIQLGPSSTNGAPLPTPDLFIPFDGPFPVNIGTSGKLAFTRQNPGLAPGPCPLPNANVMDFVGFGSTANCFEGSGPTPTLSTTTAAIRKTNGCTDTDNNAGDFSIGLPTPRNSSSPVKLCTSTGSVHFSFTAFAANESSGSAIITVTRTGDTSLAATVDYATSDPSALNNCSFLTGNASSRCDYATSVGTVRFAAGQTSKTISIPIVDDSYAEGSENFTITLSNPVGAVLDAPNTATVTITDNEGENGPNPIDLTPFFVRQHYIDFLNREPDPTGYAGWQAVINNCTPGDTNCDRIHVSSAFFRSPEFQDRGYFVYRFYPVSFGRKPNYAEFMPDIARVSGFLSNTELEAAKVAFVNEFITRPEFTTRFNGLNNADYVDALLSTAGVTSANRDFWVASLGNGSRNRAQVLREIAESTQVYNKYYNEAFVVMQYFGYLRRDPDGLYSQWINTLNTTGDFRVMVNGFVNSTEYRNRFGP